ncbi:MAG: phosphoribosylanthranilate isomerase [Terriglobales bacterium]
MIWIKICGTTNLEDALAAVDAGADAIGFQFTEGVRRIEAELAATVAAELPVSVEKVGVFGNEKPERIREIVKLAGLTAVQLLGRTPDFAEQLFAADEPARPKLYLTLSLPTLYSAATVTASLHQRQARLFDALVVDSGQTPPVLAGDAGRTFDWDRARPFIAGLKKNAKVVVGGGLTSENVGRALQLFEPWGVDVDAGVESKPGRKNLGKMREFVLAVRTGSRQ